MAPELQSCIYSEMKENMESLLVPSEELWPSQASLGRTD